MLDPFGEIDMIRDHSFIDARSRAWHALMASRIRENPSWLVEHSRPRALWLIEQQPSSRIYFEQWLALIDLAIAGDIEPLLAKMTEDSERANALRQSTVFTGLIGNKERFAFLREWSEKVTDSSLCEEKHHRDITPHR